MTRKVKASVGLSVLLAAQGLGVAQVEEIWRDSDDFASDADTATIVEPMLDLEDDVGVMSVGTVTDSMGRTYIAINVYRDNGSSVTLLDTVTIPESGDPSAWFDLDFVATDAHASAFGFAVCGYAVDPSTWDEVGVAACYKMTDLDDTPPMDRTWARLLGSAPTGALSHCRCSTPETE